MEYDRYDMAFHAERVMLGLALKDETFKIRKIAVVPHEALGGDQIYLFYDKKEVLVEKESERLSALRSIAFEITKNAVYGKLTNAKQRNLYLCEFCHISKSDADDVIELVKIIDAEYSVVRDEALLKAKAEQDKQVVADIKAEEKRLVAEGKEMTKVMEKIERETAKKGGK